MTLFQKTGQARVAALIGKVSTFVDELNKGIEEIDAAIRANDIAQAQLSLDSYDLTTSRQQASALAKNLSKLTEE